MPPGDADLWLREEVGEGEVAHEGEDEGRLNFLYGDVLLEPAGLVFLEGKGLALQADFVHLLDGHVV